MGGYILWEGASKLDGKPIVVVATDNSSNRKTGGMVQTWIMRADIAPHEALKTGDDASVCGNCPHRPANHGACYVTVHQAPLAVWKAYHRGRYTHAARGQFAGRVVRIGSYGDPAAVPSQIWDDYTHGAIGWTGYTHQWRESGQEYARYCMASCDTPDDKADAKRAGYRTFRIRLETEARDKREVVCPASAEGGHKLNCADCRACCGTSTGRQGDVVIIAHGTLGKVNAYRKMRAA